MKKDILCMKKKEFWELPKRKWNENIGPFESLVILPTCDYHDSGYRCMDFVAVDKDMYPICRLSGISDVIEIDGIGGHGEIFAGQLTTVKGWKIDCLPCGYLRLFASGTLTCGEALSSFEVFCKRKVMYDNACND